MIIINHIFLHETIGATQVPRVADFEANMWCGMEALPLSPKASPYGTPAEAVDDLRIFMDRWIFVGHSRTHNT